MKSEWRKVRLGDVAEVVSGYAYKSSDFLESGIPVIKIKNIVPPYVLLNDIQYISDELAYQKEKYLLKYNDILISLTGSNINQINSAVGKVGRIRYKEPSVLNQRVGKFEIDNHEKYDYDFLYYIVSQPEIQYLLATSAQGSANQANISPDQIKSLLIPCPPIPTQRAIAATLSCLDDKIELNNRINANLEAQAQAIFKSWFVDFEPFKDGKFVDSELGRIPKGWRVGTLGEIINLFDSKRIPISGNERLKMNKIYPYYGAAGLMDYVDNYIFDGIYLLFGEDGTVIDSSGYPILQYVWGKFWVNNHAHIIQGFNGWNVESLYILLKQTNVQSSVTGAVQPKINQINLKALKVIIPPKSMISKYNDIIAPLFAHIRVKRDESRTLTTIRDTLFPKLMSGEVEVEEEIK